MELLSPDIKKFRKRKPRKKTHISRNKNPKRASYIPEKGTFQPRPKKIKKIHSEKNSLHFRKWNFLTLRLKNFLYFLKKKFFLYFLKKVPILLEMETPPKFFISRNGTFLYFGKGIFRTLAYLEP